MAKNQSVHTSKIRPDDGMITYKVPSNLALDLEILISRSMRMAELLKRLEDDEDSSGDERMDIMAVIVDTVDRIDRILDVGRVAQPREMKAGAR